MKDDRMPKNSDNRKKKEVIIAEVQEKVDRSKGMVFTNYQGLKHQQLEKMKRELKKLEAEFVVIKNTLMLRTLSEKNLSEANKSQFEQPTGTLFMYNDIATPLKQLAKMIKEFNLPSIKFGLIENAVVDQAGILKMSTLPPIEILRAQLLGVMIGPVQGLHRALSWNTQKLVLTLKAIETKKSEAI